MHLHDLLAGDPLLVGNLTTGAVRGGAADYVELVDDLVLVELLVGGRIATELAALDHQLRAAAEGRLVVLEHRSGDYLLLARSLAILVVADEDRAVTAAADPTPDVGEGAHRVENPGRRVAVPLGQALAVDDLVVELGR